MARRPGSSRITRFLTVIAFALLVSAIFVDPSRNDRLPTRSSARAVIGVGTEPMAARSNRLEAPTSSSSGETCRISASGGSIAIPDRAAMTQYAERVARELWGDGAHLVDAQTQTGAEGRPMSYLFMFSLGGPLESKEEILAALAKGTDPIAWDGRVRCLEMGASEDVPPVACHWQGLPPEVLQHHQSVEALREEFGDRPYKLVRRYLYAAFPVFEFQADGEPFFYQPSTGQTSRHFVLRENEKYGKDEKSRTRLALVRGSWERFLNRMGE